MMGWRAWRSKGPRGEEEEEGCSWSGDEADGRVTRPFIRVTSPHLDCIALFLRTLLSS